MHIEDIKIPGQTTLAAKLYVPAQEGPHPGIVLVHGFASCKEEFMALPHALCNAGFATLAFDFSGHGESTGPRGYVSVNSHLDDLLRAYQTLVDRPEVDFDRTALVGHSLGTAAVLRFLGTGAAKNVKGSALLAPPYQIRQSTSRFEKDAYLALSTLAKPWLKLTGRHNVIPYRVNPQDIYESPEAIERAKQSKILLPYISVHNYEYLMEKQDSVIYAEKVTAPTLVMVAQKDKLINPTHSRAVYDALASADKTWVEIEDSGHSMLGDRKAKQVTADLIEWMKPHLASPLSAVSAQTELKTEPASQNV